MGRFGANGAAEGRGLAISRQVVWSALALRNLQDIHGYVGQFAPLAAQRLAARLAGTVEKLADHPDRGRPVGSGVREMVVIAPYVVRYRVSADRVEVIRIRHGAQRPD